MCSSSLSGRVMSESDPASIAAEFFRRAYELQISGDFHQAIRVDPDFGNPYNDIGAYLIEQEKWDDAIPWFEKAMVAKRYEARCYPHFNLGRVYEHQHKWEKAKKCYRQAYSLNREYLTALTAFRRLSATFN